MHSAYKKVKKLATLTRLFEINIAKFSGYGQAFFVLMLCTEFQILFVTENYTIELQ